MEATCLQSEISFLHFDRHIGRCSFLLESSTNNPSHSEWHLSVLPSLPELAMAGDGWRWISGKFKQTYSFALCPQWPPEAGPSETAGLLSQWDQWSKWWVGGWRKKNSFLTAGGKETLFWNHLSLVLEMNGSNWLKSPRNLFLCVFSSETSA